MSKAVSGRQQEKSWSSAVNVHPSFLPCMAPGIHIIGHTWLHRVLTHSYFGITKQKHRQCGKACNFETIISPVGLKSPGLVFDARLHTIHRISTTSAQAARINCEKNNNRINSLEYTLRVEPLSRDSSRKTLQSSESKSKTPTPMPHTLSPEALDPKQPYHPRNPESPKP